MHRIVLTEEQLQNYIKTLIFESRQDKLAQDFLKDKGYNDYNKRMEIIGSLKHDIPNLRLDKGKFVLAALRMYLDDRSLNNEQSIRSLDNALKYIHAGNHTNEYDENLNGLSLQELSNTFREISRQQSANDRERSNNRQFGNGNGYTIIPIESYKQAKKYGQYTSWCVTQDDNAFDSYTKGGNRFYFCLKQGFEQLNPVVGDGCPLDEYGLSMISVNIDYEGNLTRVTTRWNHNHNGENNPNLETPEQLENILGVPFYKTFKPYTRDELHQKGVIMFDEVQKLLDRGKKPKKIFEWVDDFSEGFACVNLNNKWSFIDKNYKLIGDGNLWFDNVGAFSEGFSVVKLNNKYSYLDTTSKLIGDGNLWFDLAGEFSEGFAGIKLNNKWSFIDKNGKLIGDGNLWFNVVGDFKEGFAWVKLNNNWSFIDTTGKLIGDGNLWFDLAGDFKEGFAKVKLNNKWYLLRNDGVLCDLNTKEPVNQPINESLRKSLDLMNRMK